MLHVGPQSQRKVLRLAQIQTENNVRTTNVLGFVLGGPSNPRLGTGQCMQKRTGLRFLRFGNCNCVATERKQAENLRNVRATGHWTRDARRNSPSARAGGAGRRILGVGPKSVRITYWAAA